MAALGLVLDDGRHAGPVWRARPELSRRSPPERDSNGTVGDFAARLRRSTHLLCVQIYVRGTQAPARPARTASAHTASSSCGPASSIRWIASAQTPWRVLRGRTPVR